MIETVMKACCRCKKILSIEKFHKDECTKDKLSSSCKECRCIESRILYIKHREKKTERVRKYYNLNKKELQLKGFQKRKNNKHKIDAQNLLNRSIKIRASVCECCLIYDKTEAHHHDYDQPLNVTWLCGSCHMQLHKGTTKLSIKVKDFMNNKFKQETL